MSEYDTAHLPLLSTSLPRKTSQSRNDSLDWLSIARRERTSSSKTSTNLGKVTVTLTNLKSLHVVIRLRHKLCLRTECWCPKLSHDILVGKVMVGVHKVPLYQVSSFGFFFYRHLLALISWSPKQKNKGNILSRNLRPENLDHVLDVRRRYLPHEFLIACLALQFPGAECTNTRREIGELAHWSWFTKNWNWSRLINVRLAGCKWTSVCELCSRFPRGRNCVARR